MLFFVLNTSRQSTSVKQKMSNVHISIKMSDADCVAELMRMYQELTKEKMCSVKNYFVILTISTEKMNIGEVIR